MEQQEIILTIGPPASGKTTWARSFANSNGGYINICRDDIRVDIGSRYNIAPHSKGEWTKDHEKKCSEMQSEQVINALRNGLSVIVSDTNLDESTRTRFHQIVNNFSANIRYVHFYTDYDELVKRDQTRYGWKYVGEDIIKKFYINHIEQFPTPVKGYRWIGHFDDYGFASISLNEYHPKGKRGIICDIDGTLAHRYDRSPFEWDRVDEDEVDIDIKYLVQMFERAGYDIVLVSGRDEVCREKTEKWLKDNKINYHALFMRPKNSRMKDSVVKHDLYHKYIHRKWTIDYVLDDRGQVVRQWRNMGFRVLDVAGYEF